jgi:hypothetical protein
MAFNFSSASIPGERLADFIQFADALRPYTCLDKVIEVGINPASPVTFVADS